MYSLIILLYKKRRYSPIRKKIGPAACKKCSNYRYTFISLPSTNFCHLCNYFFLPHSSTSSSKISCSLEILVSTAFLNGNSTCIHIIGLLKMLELRQCIHTKDNELFGGIYSKVRHPQAATLLHFGWITGLLLNSPFLVLLSFIWIPTFYL